MFLNGSKIPPFNFLTFGTFKAQFFSKLHRKCIRSGRKVNSIYTLARKDGFPAVDIVIYLLVEPDTFLKSFVDFWQYSGSVSH